MPTPTPEQLTETFEHAIGLVHQLTDDAAWLWVDAYWPPGRNADRPTRIRLTAPVADGDPDHVPGERLALGIGRDDVRAAYTRSALLLVDAHRLAGVAICHYTGRKPPVGGRRPPRGHEYRVVAEDTRRRLRWLAERDVAHDRDDAPRLKAHAACVALIEAHGALTAVMKDLDGTGEAPLQRRCKTCQGPAAEGRTECWKCINYRMRHKGRTRPVPRNQGAFAARDRRRGRGEDHGDTPLPRGRYVDGEWTEAS